MNIFGHLQILWEADTLLLETSIIYMNSTWKYIQYIHLFCYEFIFARSPAPKKDQENPHQYRKKNITPQATWLKIESSNLEGKQQYQQQQ